MAFLTLVVLFLRGVLCTHTVSELFNFEKTFLSDDELFQAWPDTTPKSAVQCKSFPGDEDWPRTDVWDSLNATVNGNLLKPAPIAAVCYNNTVYGNFDTSECQGVSKSWSGILER
jgi:hypothetical protein